MPPGVFSFFLSIIAFSWSYTDEKGSLKNEKSRGKVMKKQEKKRDQDVQKGQGKSGHTERQREIYRYTYIQHGVWTPPERCFLWNRREGICCFDVWAQFYTCFARPSMVSGCIESMFLSRFSSLASKCWKRVKMKQTNKREKRRRSREVIAERPIDDGDLQNCFPRERSSCSPFYLFFSAFLTCIGEETRLLRCTYIPAVQTCMLVDWSLSSC